jgi:hypothetical protein
VLKSSKARLDECPRFLLPAEARSRVAWAAGAGRPCRARRKDQEQKEGLRLFCQHSRQPSMHSPERHPLSEARELRFDEATRGHEIVARKSCSLASHDAAEGGLLSLPCPTRLPRVRSGAGQRTPAHGHRTSHRMVAELLHQLDYSLQTNRKNVGGRLRVIEAIIIPVGVPGVWNSVHSFVFLPSL